MCKRSNDYNPGAGAVQVMTMKVSKGLEFLVVALPGEDEAEAARVFYVAATRATQRLVMGVVGDGKLVGKLHFPAQQIEAKVCTISHDLANIKSDEKVNIK